MTAPLKTLESLQDDAGQGLAASPCSLSSEEVQQLKDALWKARCDIWQTARVSEYNLTGKDPNFPGDAPDAVPNPPTLIHRAGLDESYAVFEEVCAALKMLSSKSNSPQKADCPSAPRQPCFFWWVVISPHGVPWPGGISPNKTCAIRRFLEMQPNTPLGSGRAEEQRRRWNQAKRKGFWLTRVKISQANAQADL